MARRDKHMLPLLLAPSRRAERKFSGEMKSKINVDNKNIQVKRIFIR